jgi:uncharacterized protein (DUF433 family)
MELQVVRTLVDQGLSLQHVRRAAAIASEEFNTPHPFASRRVFTDGRKIFTALVAGEPELVELSRRGIHQLIAGAVLQPFLEEIDFDANSSMADRWWPLGRNIPVVLDPRVDFGAPVIAGTRVRTSTIASVAHSASVNVIASSFRITETDVSAALKFEDALLAA